MKTFEKKSMSNKEKEVEEEKEEQEPVSPTGRLLHSQKFNLSIILVMGYNTKIDPILYKKCLSQTLLKHPRFNSILIKGDDGKFRWKRTTTDIENHIFVPDVDPNMESPDKFVADYASNLSEIPMDMTKSLWELHILNVKTSDAESMVIGRLHHSMGDGVSLIALTHACARKIDDPDSLPVFPSSSSTKKKGESSSDERGLVMRLFAMIWKLILIVIYTLTDIASFLATLWFARDAQTPIKLERGSAPSQKRFVHRIVSLNDVKLVKTAMNVSVNDVVLGITEAGLSRYLSTIYENNRENGKTLPKNLCIRSTVVFNLRPSPTIEDLVGMMEKEELNGMWGNLIGIVLLPFKLELQKDPLTYIRRAKSTMDRKKLSVAHIFAFVVMKLVMFLFGIKASSRMVRAIFENTTLTFSNVMGLKEEVTLFGHHLNYIAPSIYGFPQSLAVHYQSCGDKLVISVGADEKLIPNPLQLCDDFIKSLQNIKEAVIQRGLVDVASQFC